MQPHEQRVLDEKTELDDKLTKLRQFISSPTFTGLPSEEQVRLIRQAQYMTEYSNVLAERIGAFPISS